MTEEEKQSKERKPKRRGKGEGSIYYDKKNDRYVGSFYTQEGKRKYVYGKTEKVAREKLRATQRAEEQGLLVAGPKQTLRQFLEHWLENVHKPRIRVSTYVYYHSMVHKHILPELGHLQLRNLKPEHVEAFYARMEKEGLSAGTVNLMHGVLHKALEQAVRRGMIPRNVCDLVSPPRLATREAQPLTTDQAHKLLEVVRGHQLEAALTLALVTGIRRGELLGLRWQDIDFEKKSLQIRRTLSYLTGHGFKESEPKTAASRRKIILPKFVLDVLKRYRAQQKEIRLKVGPAWQDHDLVFCNGHGGFLRPDRLVEMFHTLLKDAGLPHMRFHDLRHSAATLLLSMGVAAKVVQEILGHSRIGVTLDTYSHVLPGMQQDAMEKWDEWLRDDGDAEEESE